MTTGLVVLLVLLAAGFAFCLAYVLFGTGREIWVGDLDNHRPLDWDTLRPWSRRLREKILDREGDFGRRHRARIAAVLAAVPVLIGAVVMTFTGSYPGAMLLFVPLVAVLPRFYYRPPRTDRREIDAILPSIIVNIRALISDNTVQVPQAFMLAIADGEGPVFEMLRADLSRVGVGYSFERALMRAADSYRRPLFYEFARIVSAHQGPPSELDGPLEQIEERIFEDYEVALREIIATRLNLLLVLGIIFLLPSLGLLLLFPLAMQFLGMA